MKKFGFTLAEVLITLAIIGVVAAITLPSLNDDIGLKSIEKQSSKFYNTLVNSISMIQADEQVDDISSINLTPEMIFSKMKVKRSCTVSECAPAQYGFVGSSDKKSAAEIFSGIKKAEADIANTNNANMVELDDGTLVYISPETLVAGNSTITQPLTIYVDINGKKGPNIMGRDLWVISIDEDGNIGDTVITTTTTTPQSEYENEIVDGSNSNITVKSNLFAKECTSLSGACFNTFRNNGFKFNCK